MADILTIGSSGLSAYKRQLEVTGNNIVNANTEGYSRRDVQLQGVGVASETVTGLNNGSGGGVAVELIGRATDDFVQAQARQASSAANAASALSDRLDRLQKNLFSADTDLGASIQNFFNKIQDLSTTPTSLPIRVTVLQATDSLAADFRAQADKLNQEATAVLTDAKSQLNQTNALTGQLADINKNLNTMGSDPSKTNDLLDQRDKVINQIAKLVNVTVETRPNGAANLYLGDGTGGPQLVNASGAKDLSIVQSGNNLSITMDPYGSNTPIGQINSGAVGGILAFSDHVASSLDQLNRLAAGLAAAVNAVHTQGVDLQGRKGLPLLSTDNLQVNVPKTNSGTGSATLDVTNATNIGSGSYSARFNAKQQTWTVTNDVTKAQASGSTSVTIDGLKVNFSGLPGDGDRFTFSPLKDAAAGLHLLLQDPNQLAASLPQLAQSGLNNTGTATIKLNTLGGVVAPPALQSLSSIFSHALSPAAALGVMRDGAVATVPSGATNISLSSLSNISAATFQLDPNQLLANVPALLQLTVNNVSQPAILLFPRGQSALPPDSTNDPLNRVVNEINRSLDAANLSDKLYASASNGNIVINALDSARPSPPNTVTRASIQSDPAINSGSFSATASIETRADAADIELLTREGHQIAGAPLTSADASALLSQPNNGFSAEASYSPNGIRGSAPTLNLFAAGDLTIDGVSINASTSMSDLVAKINTVTGQTGVAATLNNDHTVSLSDSSGKAITIGGIGATKAGLMTGTFSNFPSVVNGQTPNLNLFETGELSINGLPVDAATNLSDFVANINQLHDQTGVTAILDSHQVINLTDGSGRPISIGGTAPAKSGFIAGTFSGTSYRGISVTTTTSPLPQPTITNNSDGTQTAQVAINVVPETDSPWQTAAGRPQAGAVYSIAVDGLKSIRLAGDAIAGKDSTAIASALADRITASVPQRSLTGMPISLSPTDGIRDAQFTLSINNTQYAVTFHRSASADGTLLPSGTFTVQGNPGIKITLNAASPTTSPATQFVSISLPKSATTKPPILSLSGDGATALGLGSLQQSVMATKVPSQGLTDPQKLYLSVGGKTGFITLNPPLPSAADQPLSLTLTNENGQTVNDASGNPIGITVTANINGQLILRSSMSSPALGFATNSMAARNTATALGFMGTDLTVSSNGGNLSITSSVTDRPVMPSLVDTSASVSRIGKTISLAGPLPEDLILATKAAPGGTRLLTASFPDGLTRTNPQLPDIDIRVSAPGQIEITDRASGSLLATRSYTSGNPVNYMGANFQIDGNAQVGDAYTVTTDLNRTGDNRNGLKLASLQNEDLLGPGSGTFQDIYANEVSKIGASAQAAQTAATSTKSVSDNLTAAFSTATGVNMDNEASNLLQMQQAYQACAQVISTARDMFASILKAF